MRLEQGRAGSASSASSSGGSLFGGIGSFVDSTVKFLVTGADAPAAPAKVNPPDRAPAPQQGNAVSSTGPKVVFFNPHAGRSQIAQQLHQQPSQTQHKPVYENAVGENEQARAVVESAPLPASPPPKIDRSNSDPVKSDASKSVSGSPGEKQKGKGWGIGSFIGGIVSKVLPVSKGVEVDLGEESTMYYNEKLGRYVERGKEDEVAAAANVAPPPVVAAWSEQPAATHAVSSQPGLSEYTNAQGAVGFNAVQAPVMNAPSLPSVAAAPPLPSMASGPPLPSGAARPLAPPSSSALGKSR